MEHQNYQYKSNGTKNNVEYYTCSSPNVSCNGTLKRKIDGTIVCGKSHTHDPFLQIIEKNKFRKVLIDRAQSETTRLKIIYDEEAIRNPNMAYTYPWTSAESSMRKARRAHVPVLPETLNALGEILAEQENLIQCNGHRFFQECVVDGNGKAHVMFACPEVINDVILNEGTELHADATFKVVPSMPKCRQLFIMHIIIQNQKCFRFLLYYKYYCITLYVTICIRYNKTISLILVQM
ncbi:unnamed protein product [Macrosiphum euphorbiae]|uniref:FLYWCH-type domain-containing protein n=1 Tax=Macrosiphum euphorbiae TaxID=13131 RepID=A0AAV0Y8H5_9HEMI|nr:unnamed protein product [Macrosiphum euphorbiae]